MFKVNPVRKLKFSAKHDDGLGKETSVVEYSVTFDFVIAETMDYGQLRDILSDKTPVKILNEEGKPIKDPKTEQPIETAGMLNGYYFALRTSLVNWDGICDMEGNPLPVRDEKSGDIIQANQKAVFEAIRLDKELFDRIQIAYQGHKGKN